jgi:RHS repeat-associated protein
MVVRRPGRLASTGRLNGTGPEAEVLTYTYPYVGGYAVTDADGNKTTHLIDDAGDCCTIIDPLGNITRYSFDANDNLVKVVGADGTTATYTYDANGNMTSATDPLGYTIHFTYNQFSEPLTFEDQKGNTTTYTYDSHGNLLETTYADGTTQQAVYNSLGEVTQSVDARGQSITYAYNTNGQLTAENLPGGTSNTYTYDGHGNLFTADGPGGNWSFTYNSQDLPTTIVEPYGTLSVQYGIDGNVTKEVDQTGFTTKYIYDTAGRLSELTDGSGNLIESYTYDPAGNIVTEAKGNGTSTTYSYNADGDITQITNLAPGGSINSQMTYTYNSVGEVTSMTTGGVTTTYQYDADGQLIAATSPGQALQYAYDPAGNRTSTTTNGVVTNYTVNNRDEYTQVGNTTYQYDADGNLIAATTNGQSTTYAFNALNQLTGVSGSNGTFSYVYDPLGYQIASTANGQTTNNLIDPFGLGNVAAQFNSSGNKVAHYTYGLGLVSQVSASGSAYYYYYDFNLQGSTVGLTNVSGAYVNQYSYDPFGQVTAFSGTIANPFTFVGQYGVSSDGNGLIDMRARYYDPAAGQFDSNDPLGLGGRDADLRRYAGNAPIVKRDPGGLDWAAVGGVYGGAIAGCVYTLAGDFVGGPAGAAFWGAYGAGVGAYFGSEWLKYLESIQDPYQIQDDRNWLDKFLFPPAWGETCPQPPKPRGPKPPRASGGSGGGGSSNNTAAHDPNDLLGPSGFGPSGFLTPGGALPYTIEFSNEKTAQVPADNVVVTEQLSPNLNWSTFRLGTIGFGSYVVNVPAGLTSYRTRVDATATLGVYVDINASLNLSTGLLTLTFTSLDPKTLDTPANPLVGFLPPDTHPPNGEGYINYTIQPKAGLATGAAIDAQASIVFDTNAPIATPQIVNTIDATPPTSTVAALPASSTGSNFSVSWSGSDGAGPGIAIYNVYVSDNGGPFTLWQSASTATSAVFAGQVGHTYGFYSVATDNVGLVQPTPSAAQAITLDVAPAPAVVQFAASQFSANVTAGAGQITISRNGNLAASLTAVLSSPGGHEVAAFTETVTISPNVTSQVVSIPIANDGKPGESDVKIPLSLSSPGSGASLGAQTAASLVIHDNNPLPAPVIVESLKAETIKIGTGRRAKSTTALVLQFSGALNPAQASSLAAFHLLSGRVKKGHTIYNKTVPLSSAIYSPSAHTVELIPKSKLNLTQPEELIITAAQLTDIYGRPLDGNDDGQPGGNFVATITKKEITIVSPKSSPATRSLTAAAVGSLIETGRLSSIGDIGRPRKGEHRSR